MKLIQSEIDAEAEKWNEPQNEIVKVIYTGHPIKAVAMKKALCCMALVMPFFFYFVAI
jgi:hypothetical protein